MSGTVVESLNKHPLEAVTVQSTSGNFFITDSLGKYHISAKSGDSIWFSYLNKNTQKFPVDNINNLSNFDISFKVDVVWLPTVIVKNKNYRLDSLQRRKDYENIFNFRKPNYKSICPAIIPLTVNIDELINAFRKKRNKSLLDLQSRLLQEEEDAYINHQFTKSKIKQFTKITDSADIAYFIETYRPTGDSLKNMNDLELGLYIQNCYKDFILKQNIYNK